VVMGLTINITIIIRKTLPAKTGKVN